MATQISELGLKLSLDGADIVTTGYEKAAAAGDKMEATKKRLTAAERDLLNMMKAHAQALEVEAQRTHAAEVAIGQGHANAINRDRQMLLAHTDALEANRRITEANLAAQRRLEQEIGGAMASAIERDRRAILMHADALEMDRRMTEQNAAAARTMALAHAEALRMNEGLGKSAHGAAAGLGTLRQELVTATRNTLSLNPVVAQLGGLLGHMAIGDIALIGILAGIAAIGFAYEKLTEKARKAKEEHQKLVDKLKEIADKEILGPAGETGRETAAGQTQLRAMAAKIAQAQREADALTSDQTWWGVRKRKQLKDLQDEYKTFYYLVQAGERETARLLAENAKAQRDAAKAANEEAQKAAEFALSSANTYTESIRKFIFAAQQLQSMRNLGVQYAAPKVGGITGPSAPNLGQAPAGLYPTEGLFDIPKLRLAAADMVRIAESAARLSDSLGLINRQLGAIVGGIGQVIGGGPVGIAGGIFTIIAAVVTGQQQAAAALRQAVDSLNASIASFVGDNSLAGQIAGVNRQAQGLRQQAISTYGPIIGESMGRRGQEEFAQATKEINEAEAKRIQQLKEEARILREEFFTGIDKALSAARGMADPTLAINEAYRDNIIKASSLGATMEEQARITELYRAQLDQLNDTMDKAMSQGLLSRFFAATGGSPLSQPGTYTGANAAWFQRFDEYVRGLEEQKRQAEIVAQQAQLQTDVLQNLLSVNQRSLDLEQQSVQALRQTVESLRKYSDSLKLGTLSPLSATDRYLEAQRQYQAIASLARGGDQSAIASLPDTANRFLEESRNMFASSTRYVQDFQSVQAFIGQMTDQYGAQLTTEEKILAELQKQNDALQTQISILNKQLDTSTQQTVLDLVAMLNRNENVTFATQMLRSLGFVWQRNFVDAGGGMVTPVYPGYPVATGAGPARQGGTTDAYGQYWPEGWGQGANTNADQGSANIVAAVNNVVAEVRSLKTEIRFAGIAQTEQR